MRKSKVKELKQVIKVYHSEVEEGSAMYKTLLRKYKKQYNRGNYNK